MDIQQAPFSNTTQGLPAYDRFGAPTLLDPDGDAAPSGQPGINASFGNDRIVRSGDSYEAGADDGGDVDQGGEAAFSRGALLYDEDDGSFTVIVPRNDWSAGAAPDADAAADDGLVGVRIVA